MWFRYKLSIFNSHRAAEPLKSPAARILLQLLKGSQLLNVAGELELRGSSPGIVSQAIVIN